MCIKCAVIGNVGNFALVDFADLVLVGNGLPRVTFQLLHAETDALVVFVEFDNLNLNRLTDRQNFRRMIDSLPGNVGNVQQTVNAAEVNERTVIGNVLDNAFQNGTFFQGVNCFIIVVF